MKGNMKGKRRIFGNILLWILGIWVVVMIAVQVLLSPKVLTGIVNDVADGLIDGDVRFGKVSTSMIRNFPNLTVTLHDFDLTYPNGRFSGVSDGNMRIMKMGSGEEADTLASFKEFSASVNLASLAIGRISIPSVTLTHPRIFAKSYNDSTANWNIFKTGGEDVAEADTVSAGLPDITLGKIVLDGRPMIAYCSEKDTLAVFMKMKRMNVRGKLSTRMGRRPKLGLEVDSLFVSGRMAQDTVGLGLRKLHVEERDGIVGLKASARTFVASRKYGRVGVPIEVDSHIEFLKDTVPAVAFRNTTFSVGGVPFSLEAEVRYMKDSLYLRGKAGVDGCDVSKVLGRYGKLFFAGSGDLKTDAVLTASAVFDGWYDLDGGRIPQVGVCLDIPDAMLQYKPFGLDGKLGVGMTMDACSDWKVNVSLDKFSFKGPAIDADFSGKAFDMLGSDPLFDVDAALTAWLDVIGSRLKPDSGYRMGGQLDAELEGKIRLSQMNLANLADADIKACIKSPALLVASVRDSIDVYIDSLDFDLATGESRRASKSGKKLRVMSLDTKIDSASIAYRQDITLKGRDIFLKTRNEGDVFDASESSTVHPVVGKLEIGGLSLKDSQSATVAVRNSSNSFIMYPKDSLKTKTAMKFKSKNQAIFFRHPAARVFLASLDMDFGAENADIRSRHASGRGYSHRDSTSVSARTRRGFVPRVTPEWMSEADFRKSDFDFKLDKSVTDFLRKWSLSGNLAFEKAGVSSPMFPLRTSVSGFKGSVNNDGVNITNFNLKSGQSSLSAHGRLYGMSRALRGYGRMKLELDADADGLNLNELLAALAKGAAYETVEGHEQLSDEQFSELATTDTLATVPVSGSKLVVVPANLEADISLTASDVTYSTMQIAKATADIRMKQRCVQIVNVAGDSNIGDIAFEGFYSTRTKKNLKTGFRLRLDDITADKVIELLPAVDSLMPILKSFKGNLNGELAVTADLDTCMNIVMPSVNGVMRIQGKNLVIADDPAIMKLAKVLKFNDRSGLHVDKMSVEGQIKDNVIEVFPFILDVDRYTLGMSGVQNLDRTFKYHVSIIRSPLLVRFGVDLTGNFDDFKFKIGKAKYKDKNVPVFSAVVDQASLNLSNSIRDIFNKGVDEAVRENRRQEAIERYKERMDYKNAAEIRLDSLSDTEKVQLEE